MKNLNFIKLLLTIAIPVSGAAPSYSAPIVAYIQAVTGCDITPMMLGLATLCHDINATLQGACLSRAGSGQPITEEQAIGFPEVALEQASSANSSRAQVPNTITVTIRCCTCRNCNCCAGAR